MAIQRNAGGQGNFVKEPGEYQVRIKETKMGESKTGKPMLTVVFQTHDEKLIAGYFVRELNFHMAALAHLKTACGLNPDKDGSDLLVGKECGILVEAQEPNEQGRTFMSIVGYGAKADAKNGATGFAPTAGEDRVPF